MSGEAENVKRDSTLNIRPLAHLSDTPVLITNPHAGNKSHDLSEALVSDLYAAGAEAMV